MADMSEMYGGLMRRLLDLEITKTNLQKPKWKLLTITIKEKPSFTVFKRN